MYPFLLRCCHSGPSCDLMLVIKHISGARKHLFLLFPLDFFFFFLSPPNIYTYSNQQQLFCLGFLFYRNRLDPSYSFNSEKGF